MYKHCIQDPELEVKIAIVRQLEILTDIPEANDQLKELIIGALSSDSSLIVTIAIQCAMKMKNLTFLRKHIMKLLKSESRKIKIVAIEALKTSSVPK